jgi:hypothetical protein
MGKIADLFKNKLSKAYSEPGMKLNASTMKDFSSYTSDLKEKDETTEATGSGSSGAYSAPLFGGEPDEFIKKSDKETPKLETKEQKKKLKKVVKVTEEVEKVEAKEATGTGSVGGYESPAMWAKSTKKKDWGPSRKPQIPGGGFVKVKKKCTKFPYCNQGDINAITITKNESVQDAIKNVSKKMKISEDRIKKILEQEMVKLNKRTK